MLQFHLLVERPLSSSGHISNVDEIAEELKPDEKALCQMQVKMPKVRYWDIYPYVCINEWDIHSKHLMT